MTIASFPQGVPWRVTDAGIIAPGEAQPRRTPGEPITLQRVDANFGSRIRAVSPMLQWQRTLAALFATEGGGHIDPGIRYERAEDDFSFGPLQMLTLTASGLLGNTVHPSPMPKVLRVAGLQFDSQAEAAVWAAGDASAVAWRALLVLSGMAVDLAMEYCKINDRGYHCGADPVLLYGAYNDGEPRVDEYKRDAFGIVSYFDQGTGITALDRFAAYYGDACCVFSVEACS